MVSEKLITFAKEFNRTAQFTSATQELIDHINGLEKTFFEAREGTDDPVSKVIITGMWQDFLNFKHEKWKDAFRMLAQR